ncbi:MAG: alanine racemase, partial [Phenylobacterium sp.]|nr:alanine racemase [Phenylobacterium sp.]
MSPERPLEAITAELGALALRPATALSLALIGQPGSRYQVPTPAAVIDLDAFDRNVARMAARAKAAGLALRPHAKSHKCAALARRQIAAGAVGVCCAKLGEAEALAAAGVRGILITSALAGEPSAARAAKLAGIDPAFAITVDHPDGATEIGQAARAAGVTVRVVLDVDLGMGRTGVSG